MNVMSPTTPSATPASAAPPPPPPSSSSSSVSSRSCCNSTYEGHGKMLHSLLYNFSQHMNSFAAVAPVQSPSSMAGQAASPQGAPMAPMSPVQMVASHAAAAAMASQTPSARASPASSQDSHRHNHVHRPRSGSVVSLGSTGSSFRDSYSPSHESSISHDSFSRGSPASIGSSPSPSPPAHESSKLFGLLKGTMASPYSAYYNPYNSSTTAANRSRTPTRVHTPTSSAPRASPGLKRMYSSGENEQPMDLSCKRWRGTDTPPSTPSTPFSPTESDPAPAAETGGSILKSILCGGSSTAFFNSHHHHSNHHNSSSNNSASSSSYLSSLLHKPTNTWSPSSPPAVPSKRRESTSSLSSSSSQASVSISRCSSSRSRVVLAKKMMLPVRARVSDWMQKVVQFAKSQPEFASLPTVKDKLALLSQSWTRILLLFMAETNFEFAVTPIHGEEDEGGKWDAECPTMQSVQEIQMFISKCQTLNMDAEEYHLMRMALLFYSAPSGMANADFVDKVNSYARQALLDHIERTQPTKERQNSRYSSLLMSIHTLYGINCKMVENLFCRHVLKNDEDDMVVMLKGMLESYPEDEEEEAAEEAKRQKQEAKEWASRQ